MIQLVSGEVNVLHAYIIQGERELTIPSPLHDNALAGAGRLFCRVSLLEKKKKKESVHYQQSRKHNSGSKASLWGCCSSAGSPLCCVALLLQGSFQCLEPDGEQRTQRGLGTAMYCSARSSAMHTHSLPVLLCLSDNLSFTRSISRPLLPVLVSFALPSPSSPSSHCFCLFNANVSAHTLKADCSPRVRSGLSFPSFTPSCSPLTGQSCKD